ncbi:peptidoglycan DD-metalloendopeptidase family protein [Agromyces bauzanensis]
MREREAAEALRLEGLQARVEPPSMEQPYVERPHVGRPHVSHPHVSPPSFEQPQVAPAAPFASAQPRAPRPGFDDLFGSDPAPAHPTPHPAPHVLATPVSDPAPTPALRRRTPAEPPQLPEAERTDRPVGRSSASAVSTRRDAPAGFDALFAGLESADVEEGDEDSRRPARAGRPSRTERKAAKAAKSTAAAKAGRGTKSAKAAKSAPSGPRRTGVPAAPAPTFATGDFAALVGGTAASVPTTPAAAAAAGAGAGLSAALSAAAGVPVRAESAASAPVPTPAPLIFETPVRRNPTADPIEFSTDAASDLFGFAAKDDPVPFAGDHRAEPFAGDRRAEASHAPDLARTSVAPVPPPVSRDERRLQQSAPDVARSSGPRTAKVRVRSSRPAASGTSVRGRGRRFGASLVAMSFAALLAVATTIPSLSLLSAADVQALALSGGDAPGLDGQRVELNGDIVAQSIQREGYESQTIEEYARAAGIRPEATFTNNPLGTIQWPFAVGVHIGDRFGYRDCYGCSSDHHGQDFNPGYGAEIQAIADGVVSGSTDDGGSLGVVTMIDHVIDGQVITSVYAHMEYGSRRFEVGDTVHVADVVGLTGDTGMSTGPHLHFEIRIGGVDGYWVDPLEWLYANTN